MASASLTAVNRASHEFLSWWTGELVSVLPNAWRRRLDAEPKVAVIEIGPHTMRLRASDGGADLETEIRRLRAQNREIGIQIDDPRLLRDSFLFPAAAAENLRDAVGFQIPRLTPFEVEEVAFDCRIAGPGPDGQIRVELLVLQRTALEDILERVRAAGVEPAFAGMSGDTVAPSRRLDLLVGRKQAQRRPAGVRRNMVLLVLAGLLLAALAYVDLDSDRRYIAGLTAEVERVRAQAQAAEQGRQQVENAIADTVSLVKRKRDAMSATGLIDRLSALLPDGVWLSQLRVTGGTVQLVGYAPSAAEIVELIEGADGFQGVKFLAPARRDVRTGNEQFHLSFDVTAGGK